MATAHEIQNVARALWQAEITCTPIEPISGANPDFSTDDAYGVQYGITDIRVNLGHRPCGRKIGLTSRAVQEMVGLDEPDYGQLFHEMRIDDDGVISLGGLIQPKIEPELAFVFARPLAGTNLTAADVIAAADHVTAAFEIVDCRIRDWRVRGIDAVSDNGSAARFVLSRRQVSPMDIDLGAIGLTFMRNGRIVTQTSLSEVMGNPANAVCWLAGKLSSQGRRIEAGDVVLTGAPCKPVDIAPGDVFEARFDGLGEVRVRGAGGSVHPPAQ